MKQKFLILLLLCIPFATLADAPDVDALKNDISGQTTFANAEEKYKAAFTTLKNYYSDKADTTTINDQETKVNNKISSYKNSTTTTTSTTETNTKPTDTRTEEEKKKALEEAQKKYDDAKATEQSKENRTLTALTTAATGIGGMELAMGLSEQKADKEADANMAAYIETMRCSYGDGKQIKAGPDEIELPGGNDSELMKIRNEYFALAADLKERKEALGMKPGIESEEIIDKATTGLDDDEDVGIDSGAYASLYRAQMLGSEADQAKIDDERKASKNRVIAGASVAGAGVLGGILGDSLINGKLSERIKSAKNCKAMEQFVKDEEKALKDLKSCLKKADVKNTDKLTLDSINPFYPSLFSFDKISCKSDLTAAKDKSAEDLFKMTGSNEEIIVKMVENFGAETTGKLLDVTISTPITAEQKTTAANKLKERAEAIKKRFDEAKAKDDESGCKVGVSTGSVLDGLKDGLGDGLKDGLSGALSRVVQK